MAGEIQIARTGKARTDPHVAATSYSSNASLQVSPIEILCALDPASI
jgi:hypothetical protein